MRTTITLEPEVEALVRRVMRERGIGFKQAVNDALRRGLGADRVTTSFATPTYHLGRSRQPLDQALRVAGDLEDEELRRKAQLGK
jgi:hypothetical protein